MYCTVVAVQVLYSMCTPPTSTSESDGGGALASQEAIMCFARALKAPSNMPGDIFDVSRSTQKTRQEGLEGALTYGRRETKIRRLPRRLCLPLTRLQTLYTKYSSIYGKRLSIGQRAADNTPVTQPQHTLCFQETVALSACVLSRQEPVSGLVAPRR